MTCRTLLNLTISPWMFIKISFNSSACWVWSQKPDWVSNLELTPETIRFTITTQSVSCPDVLVEVWDFSCINLDVTRLRGFAVLFCVLQFTATRPRSHGCSSVTRVTRYRLFIVSSYTRVWSSSRSFFWLTLISDKLRCFFLSLSSSWMSCCYARTVSTCRTPGPTTGSVIPVWV